MTDNDKLFYTYCGTDCCVTSECNAVMDAKLMPGQRRHYQFNLQLLAPLLFMELKGIRYDHEKAKAKYAHVQKWVYVLQDMLNRAAGRTLPAPEDTAAWVQLVRDRLCLSKPRRREEVTKTRTFKNGRTKTTVKTVSTPAEIKTLEDCREFALPSQAGAMRRVQALLKRSNYSPQLRGELSVLLNHYVKVNSTGADGDACWFLYEHCGFPKQFQKEGNKLTTRLASDDEALIKIWVGEEKKPVPWTGAVKVRHRARLALAFLRLRRLITQTKTLRVAPDEDGRMRCGYNVVGTETARLTCYESPTGSGYNLQTVTKKHRSLFLADEGCLMAQCDLSGADGWTVAAYAAAQGDRTMLDDYRAGIKPAKVGVLMWEKGAAINKLDRAVLEELCKQVDGESWKYFGFKRVQHGCYTAGHEVLTWDGWIPIEDYVKQGKTVPLLCYDNETRHAWFEEPCERQALKYSGSLYTFQGSSVDITVTAEHKIPFSTNNNPKITTASDMASRKAGHIPTACAYINGWEKIEHVRLVAAFQADGHLCEGGWVTFHFKKQRKVDRLKMLLTAAKIPFSCGHCKNGTQHFYIPKRGAINFTGFGKAASAQMLSWCQESLREYLDEHQYWDGSFGRGRKCSLSSKDPEHIVWIDTLLHLTLQNGSIQGDQISGFGTLMHRVNYNRRTWAERGSMNVTTERVSKCPVYCVTTGTGFIVVRRRGKIVVSGNSSYKMGRNTMSDQILTDSWKLTGKPVFIPPTTCEQMQQTCFFARYWGIPRWHQWMESEVKRTGQLIASNGFLRKFYGRKDDHNTVKQALAHLPQVYTTAATMMALSRLWSDPDNRLEDGNLKCEPLHTVHDSLISQFNESLKRWAPAKLREWFNNPMLIAQETLVIPFEGCAGRNWKDLDVMAI